MKKLVLAVLIMSGVVTSIDARDQFDYTHRDKSPIQLALLSPVEFPNGNAEIYGFRYNIFCGRSYFMAGLDLGLVGFTRNDLWGLSAQGLNWVDGSLCGLQMGAFLNVVRGTMMGLQVAPVNYDAAMMGLPLGVVNRVTGMAIGCEMAALANANQREMYGCQLAPLNDANELVGCQVGLFNIVQHEGTGVQLGVINAANRFSGVQIGVLNILGDGVLPIFPVINANF